MAFALGVVSLAAWVQGPPPPGDVKLGLVQNDPKVLPGYTLIAPMNSTKTYLIDNEGRVVNTWESGSNPSLSAYLLENGHLLRPGTLPPGEQGWKARASAGAFRNSPGTANSSGTSSSPTRRTSRTTTSAGCPTATC